jgi:hypothetical protein
MNSFFEILYCYLLECMYIYFLFYFLFLYNIIVIGFLFRFRYTLIPLPQFYPDFCHEIEHRTAFSFAHLAKFERYPSKYKQCFVIQSIKHESRICRKSNSRGKARVEETHNRKTCNE